MKKGLSRPGCGRRRRSAEKSFGTMRTFKRHARTVSQTIRHEVAELGEVGAEFLAVWLVAVLVALLALLAAWAA